MHPFAVREFRLFWFARLCSTLAQNMLVVVIGWQVYDLARRTMTIKGASLQLGLLGLTQFLPLLGLTLVAGWAADHLDRRYIARASILLQGLCAALLAAVSFAHVQALAPFFVVAALQGAARAFSMPTMSALAPNLVPREILPRAIATTAIAGRVGGIVGPAAGGLVYAWARPAPYVLGAALLMFAFGAMMMIGPVREAPRRALARPWSAIVEGLAYIRRTPVVLAAISLDLFAVLLGGATALLPPFAHDVLKVGAGGLGALRAAPAVGALAAALWLSHRPLGARIGVKMLVAVAIFGAATIGFGLSRWLPASLACLAILGATDMISVYVRQSLVQLSTPDEMRGRVGSVSTLFISASNELGEAESGVLAALIGPVGAVIVGGAGSILVTIIWAGCFPSLRRAESFEVERRPA